MVKEFLQIPSSMSIICLLAFFKVMLQRFLKLPCRSLLFSHLERLVLSEIHCPRNFYARSRIEKNKGRLKFQSTQHKWLTTIGAHGHCLFSEGECSSISL